MRNICPECGGRTFVTESTRYFARWDQCDCGWRGPVEIIPADERVEV